MSKFHRFYSIVGFIQGTQLNIERLRDWLLHVSLINIPFCYLDSFTPFELQHIRSIDKMHPNWKVAWLTDNFKLRPFPAKQKQNKKRENCSKNQNSKKVYLKLICKGQNDLNLVISVVNLAYKGLNLISLCRESQYFHFESGPKSNDIAQKANGSLFSVQARKVWSFKGPKSWPFHNWAF